MQPAMLPGPEETSSQHAKYQNLIADTLKDKGKGNAM